jgi:hypothetical protein
MKIKTVTAKMKVLNLEVNLANLRVHKEILNEKSQWLDQHLLLEYRILVLEILFKVVIRMSLEMEVGTPKMMELTISNNLPYLELLMKIIQNHRLRLLLRKLHRKKMNLSRQSKVIPL